MNSISKDLLMKIKMDKPVGLSMHSIYRDVINTVDVDGNLIVLLNHKKHLSPMSIVIDDLVEFENLRQQGTFTLAFAGESLVDLSDIAMIDLYLYARPAFCPQLISAGSILLRFLEQSAPPDSFYAILSQLITGEAVPCESSWDNRAREIMIPKLSQYLQALYQHRPIDENLNILGFGRGLTPASDDFILGLSALLQYAGDPRAQAIKSHGTQYIGTTTFVSAQMLKNSWNGHYNLHLHRFFQAIEQGALTGQILREVSAYGHTSGFDTLCGVLMGIEFLKRNSLFFCIFKA